MITKDLNGSPKIFLQSPNKELCPVCGACMTEVHRSKENGVWWRTWLGDTAGAKAELSLDGYNWVEAVDTRATSSVTSSPATLGFATFACPVFIDDICVEDDDNFTPVIPPPPPPQPPINLSADTWLMYDIAE